MAVALLIPVLLAMSFGGIRISSELNTARQLGAGRTQVAMLDPAVRMVAAAGDLAAANNGQAAGRSSEEASRQFETTAAELRRAVESSDITTEQRRLVNKALAEASPLYSASGAEQAQRLRGVTAAVGDLIHEVSEATGNIEVLTLADVMQGLTALEAQQAAVPAGATPTVQQRAALSEAIGREAAAIQLIASHGGADSTAALQQQVEARSAAASSATGTRLPSVSQSRALYLDLVRSSTKEVTDQFDAEALTARSNALRDAALVLGSLLAALAATLLVARLILNPIQRVRRGVLQVAHHSLPAAVGEIRSGQDPAAPTPVPVHTSEEIGQLARAVDTMHVQALNLAVEQARLRAQVSGMFETMSRRSKALVDQQLVLIENLERDEEDPQRLESLFRLDHLAAQMRRNGDSLLVLAGASSRPSRHRPFTLSETVQAAISGVAGYQRVEIDALPATRVAGSASADVVHILGELIDNALSYSPPDSKVVVRAARAVDGGTLLEVVDQGLGIAEGDLEQLNARLATSSDVTPDTARRMGLYVAATLARRHDMIIRLRANAGAGITASVYLPADLVEDATREEEARSEAGSGRQPAARTSGDLDGASPSFPGPVGVSREQEPPRPTGPTLVPVPTELTPAGLPRRVPGTNLINEGGAASLAGGDTSSAPAVSAVSGDEPEAESSPATGELPTAAPRPKADTAAAFAAFFSARREVEAGRGREGDAPRTGSDHQEPTGALPQGARGRDGADRPAAGEARPAQAGDEADADPAPAGPADRGGERRQPAAERERGARGLRGMIPFGQRHGGSSAPAPAPAEAAPAPAPAPAQAAPARVPAADREQDPTVRQDLSVPSGPGRSDGSATTGPVRAPRLSVLPSPVSDSDADGPDSPAEASTIPFPTRTPAVPAASAGSEAGSTAGSWPRSTATEDDPLDLGSDAAFDTSDEATPLADYTALERAAASSGSTRIPLEDTPIFGSVRSNWLDAQGEDLSWSSEDVDEGWSAAERATSPSEPEYTFAGLPRRSPGALLVPGGSELDSREDTTRDPEDLRRRLTDLHAGVRRAREESSFPYTDASDEEKRA